MDGCTRTLCAFGPACATDSERAVRCATRVPRAPHRSLLARSLRGEYHRMLPTQSVALLRLLLTEALSCLFLTSATPVPTSTALLRLPPLAMGRSSNNKTNKKKISKSGGAHNGGFGRALKTRRRTRGENGEASAASRWRTSATDKPTKGGAALRGAECSLQLHPLGHVMLSLSPLRS